VSKRRRRDDGPGATAAATLSLGRERGLIDAVFLQMAERARVIFSITR
jgi:hypothetical protein